MTLLRDRFPGHLGAKPDLTFGSLCTGYGGLDLGVATAFGGGRLLWVADPDPHVSKVLAARMPDVPNLGDITTIDWQQVEPVDVLTAGFPCQDISAAGRRAGIRKGTRSGIWHQVVAAVRHLRPTLLIVENVAALRWRQGGLDIVLGDLAEVGYDAQWTSVRASDIGAPHRRERVFLLAYPAGTVVAARPVIQKAIATAVRPSRNPCESVRLLPTPQARDDTRGGCSPESRLAGGHQVNLTDTVTTFLPTPASSNPNDGEDPAGWLQRQARHRARGINGNGMGMPLSIAVRLLPTPRASDTGTSGRRAGAGFRPPLSQEVLPLFPTPPEP